MEPVHGQGQFQWNTWGWFGGQVGGSCWLAALSGVLFVKGEAVGGLFLALCFVVPNVMGTLFWLRRDRIAPYPAMQGLMLLLAAVSAAATAYLAVSGVLTQPWERGRAGTQIYLFLLVFPGIMLMFHLQEQAARRERRKREGGGADDGRLET